jgi:hypothetical protein
MTERRQTILFQTCYDGSVRYFEAGRHSDRGGVFILNAPLKSIVDFRIQLKGSLVEKMSVNYVKNIHTKPFKLL